MGALDLEDQLVFYRAYHYNLVNVFIHLMFIPMIFFSAILGVSSIQFHVQLPDFIQEPYASFINKHVLNLGGVLVIGYSIFYVILDRYGGSLYSAIIIAITIYIQNWYDVYPTNLIIKRSLIVHCCSWIAQFFGHGAFEHRAPAVLDNLLQPLVLAPFFVFYEILFYFGFRKDLKLRMDERAQKRIKEFRELKTK